jgi:hypothetical protein
MNNKRKMKKKSKKGDVIEAENTMVAITGWGEKARGRNKERLASGY